MSPDRLPNMLGIIVCAIVVLGINAHPMVATMMGVLIGAIAHFALAAAMGKKSR